MPAAANCSMSAAISRSVQVHMPPHDRFASSDGLRIANPVDLVLRQHAPCCKIGCTNGRVLDHAHSKLRGLGGRDRSWHMTHDRNVSVTRPLHYCPKNGCADAVVDLYCIDVLINEQIDRTNCARGTVYDDADRRRRGRISIEDRPCEK